MTKTSVKLSVLKLVYPPISNQEATWLENDQEVREIISQSDFYMIAGRAEPKFLNIDIDPSTLNCTFNLSFKNILMPGLIEIHKLPGIVEKNWEELQIETGDKFIRIWNGSPHAKGSDVLDWFTVDKLLYERWHNKVGVSGIDNYRDVTSFDLLYVGIAKEGDSYQRLIKRGHKARMDILSNEPQRYPGARVTDEILLFFFRIEPTVINTFDFGHNFENSDIAPEIDKKAITADAEKAYVSLLKPEYNILKFNQYPKGKDGLYNSDFSRYGYVIGEDVTYNTAHGKINGGCGVFDFISNDADSIFVEGDEVKLFIASKDY